MQFVYSRRVIWGVLAISLVVLVVGLWLWWTQLYQTPDRVFWQMVNNNLSTRSVTRTVAAEQDSSVTQQIRTSFTPSPMIETKTTILQDTDENQSRVVTETLGTPDEMFIRYASIETSEKGVGGKPLDFSKVNGVWARQEDSGDATSRKTDFIEALLTLAPFGNLPSQNRSEVVSAFQSSKVYEFNTDDVKKESTGGKSVYVYPVTVRTKKYAEVYQKFLSAAGLGAFAELDPSNYTDDETVTAKFTVDRMTGTLVSIGYDSNGRLESFTDFGLNTRTQVPEGAIPLVDLQNRLQNIK